MSNLRSWGFAVTTFACTTILVTILFKELHPDFKSGLVVKLKTIRSDPMADAGRAGPATP